MAASFCSVAPPPSPPDGWEIVAYSGSSLGNLTQLPCGVGGLESTGTASVS